MPIVPCPQCKKKMSSNAGFCSRCGYASGELNEQQRQTIAIRQLRDTIYRLVMTSYLVATGFVGSFGWVWWASDGFENKPSAAPFILMGSTVVIYLVIRVFMFKLNKKQKQMKKKLRKYQK